MEMRAKARAKLVGLVKSVAICCVGGTGRGSGMAVAVVVGVTCFL